MNLPPPPKPEDRVGCGCLILLAVLFWLALFSAWRYL